ncbi:MULTISPECIES: hypothetical protein [Pseudoalteromonas]|uniref:Uncharacterized protein n=2 Tax=Pseudoalteromonas TaxID=53246 RepID=A0ACA8DZY0_9GAMM|nr:MULTISPECIES: hypothetical protein [Pseudoalteromonas]MDC9520384.1 hypothetical protein [Pseudoalteromonas sp. Angola-31]ATC83644.1 hypothetical protein PAGA_a3525 [Pseudoalteromonas agarivorans DSM 14585]ETJ49908.1 hypothetical protein X564_01480 [Pseudoalteromonas agarivorans]KPW05282.1 hypothetical protein AN390_00050 [Pseudoalteromonas sp. P1-11]MCK8097043.1 hypothetical protein [Pseudoalteromonas sp. 1CM17D]
MQRFYSNLLVVVMLLTFVGQAVASVNQQCEMPHMSLSAKHATHVMSESKLHTGMMEMDCCSDEADVQNDCHCPINGCGSSSILTSPALFTAFSLSSEKVTQLNSGISSPPSNTLYRPPMFA